MKEQLSAVTSTVVDSVFGDRLLQLFKGFTKGRAEARVTNRIAVLSGVIALPGFQEAQVPIMLASNGQESRFVVGSEPAPIIRIETGIFDEYGENLEVDEQGNVVGKRAHLVAVTHSRKNRQPWDTEALLYDKTLAAIKGYAVRDLGEKGAKAEIFYKD